MSRVGSKPVPIPKGVTVTVQGRTVTVKGPKGELSQSFLEGMGVAVEDGRVVVTRASEAKPARALHGLTRALIANMVVGVTEGYRKSLEIVGVGYKAEKRGNALMLSVGHSHAVRYPEPAGIRLDAPSPTVVVVEGIDKQKVGQVAAEIRGVRPPEPYKGKGIRYQGEHVRRKAGKAGAK